MLRSDGAAVLHGRRGRLGLVFCETCDVGYTQISMGDPHLSLLTGGGTVEVWCLEEGFPFPKCVKILQKSTYSYTQIAAGLYFTVLLTSRGAIEVDCPCPFNRQCATTMRDDILSVMPQAGDGVVYTQVAASGDCMALLRSDGMIAVYISMSQVAVFPLVPKVCWATEMPLKPGVTFTQVDVAYHAVLLRSDGVCLAVGSAEWVHDYGQCDIPALEEGLAYVQASAGYGHTVLLLSDGRAVACGDNSSGQCDIPELLSGQAYTCVAAGEDQTVLGRNDGCVVICDRAGHYVPPVESHLTYVPKAMPVLALQLSLGVGCVRFLTLSGEERWKIHVSPDTPLVTISKDFLVAWHAGELGTRAGRVEAMLPAGRLLNSAGAEETVESAFRG